MYNFYWREYNVQYKAKRLQTLLDMYNSYWREYNVHYKAKGLQSLLDMYNNKNIFIWYSATSIIVRFTAYYNLKNIKRYMYTIRQILLF